MAIDLSEINKFTKKFLDNIYESSPIFTKLSEESKAKFTGNNTIKMQTGTGVTQFTPLANAMQWRCNMCLEVTEDYSGHVCKITPKQVYEKYITNNQIGALNGPQNGQFNIGLSQSSAAGNLGAAASALGNGDPGFKFGWKGFGSVTSSTSPWPIHESAEIWGPNIEAFLGKSAPAQAKPPEKPNLDDLVVPEITRKITLE